MGGFFQGWAENTKEEDCCSRPFLFSLFRLSCVSVGGETGIDRQTQAPLHLPTHLARIKKKKEALYFCPSFFQLPNQWWVGVWASFSFLSLCFQLFGRE